MGCCISQPESQADNIQPRARVSTNSVASSSIPPPQYNEQHDYVLEAGKTINQVDLETTEQEQQAQQEQQEQEEEKKNQPQSFSNSKGNNNASEEQPNTTSNSVNKDTRRLSTRPTQSMKTTDNRLNFSQGTAGDYTSALCATSASSIPSCMTTSSGWPIIVRLSMTGKDLPIDLPEKAPFWTLWKLRQHLEPQLQQIVLASTPSSSSSSTLSSPTALRVRFIHLGKILSENTTLLPSSLSESTSSSSSYCSSKGNTLTMEKNSVIQAMVSKAT